MLKMKWSQRSGRKYENSLKQFFKSEPSPETLKAHYGLKECREREKGVWGRVGWPHQEVSITLQRTDHRLVARQWAEMWSFFLIYFLSVRWQTFFIHFSFCHSYRAITGLFFYTFVIPVNYKYAQ